MLEGMVVSDPEGSNTVMVEAPAGPLIPKVQSAAQRLNALPAVSLPKQVLQIRSYIVFSLKRRVIFGRDKSSAAKWRRTSVEETKNANAAAWRAARNRKLLLTTLDK